jgi:ubiquinone/menaquinone biosynthesis C-methylase UbiE
MSDLRGGALRVLAGQLGHPHGLPGRLVGRMLNQGNAETITDAVEALDAGQEATLADLGFGGGIGLGLLLQRAGSSGRVQGIEQSATMLAAATRRFRREVSTGQLHLQQGSLEGLPLPDRSLDGAITLNTSYFLAELTAAFAEFSRVLKPTGQIVVGLGDPVAMAKLPFTAHGFRLRPVDDVRAELSLAGLQLIDHRRVGEGPNAYHLLVATPTAAAPTS